ncbi:hypothetical protein FA13DRAFT_1652018 [Coprinellus micaceus]|uniref:Uncharacterized protein n=1 Tax=Coprinellus micaceus TaxID=71717 RepID=A0A4Y7RYV6_COPMI|nr:hypothetical protein FA13DRAFT_1652018 [Coprinellus micaceus]
MFQIIPETISCTSATTVSDILKMQPTNKREALLHSAIQELQTDNELLQGQVIKMQAASILNEAHCNMLRFQLLQKEEKAKKGKGKGKLMGDGLPKMLSGDEFFQRVVEFTQWQEEQEAQGHARVDAKEAWRAAVEEWG